MYKWASHVTVTVRAALKYKSEHIRIFAGSVLIQVPPRKISQYPPPPPHSVDMTNMCTPFCSYYNQLLSLYVVNT